MLHHGAPDSAFTDKGEGLASLVQVGCTCLVYNALTQTCSAGRECGCVATSSMPHFHWAAGVETEKPKRGSTTEASFPF
jgi:hypothetical protein